MKHILIICIFLTGSIHFLSAQKFSSKTGMVSFFSEAAMENIEAKSEKLASILDCTTGEFAYVLQITSFEFKKSLMQEHFNENYMESEKFPTSTFKGKIVGKIDPAKVGICNVTAEGILTMHGVDQKVSIPAQVYVLKDGTIRVVAEFMVKLVDYKIKIPKAVIENLAEEIKVKVNILYPKP